MRTLRLTDSAMDGRGDLYLVSANKVGVYKIYFIRLTMSYRQAAESKFKSLMLSIEEGKSIKFVNCLNI
jgi:hypothetical protein